jgi:hypothetical protein
MMARPRVTDAIYLVAITAVLGLIVWVSLRPAARPSPPAPIVVIAGQTGDKVVAPALPATQPAVTHDWMLGTWSRRDDQGRRDAPCDLASVITYLPNGQYFSPSRSGRYAAGAGTVTYWATILYDIDAGEDRSQFDRRTSETLSRSGDVAMQSGGIMLYRCDKTASGGTADRPRQ